jgi:uncharacterized protein (DUF1015 family)
MAVIKPFRGVRYNPVRFPDMSTVVSQPYDRVRYGLQDQYYGLSPHNVVRIIRGKSTPEDTDANNPYTRGRDYFQTWLDEGVLIREGRPALYVYHQEFAGPDGTTNVRKALITAFELVPFEEGIVLPHERTHAGPKVDRLNLLRTTETNFGQIFMLYPDPENRVNALLEAAIADREPNVDVVELFEKGVRQRVWVVTDEETIQAVQAEMAPKRNLIIADGHHRYETALNYRNEMRATHSDAPPDAAFNYRMVALVSMDDPGLVILPTHREIYDWPSFDLQTVLEKAAEYFTVTPVADKDACFQAMAEHAGEHAFGLYADGQYSLLVLKPYADLEALIPEERLRAWKELDVSILHRVLLEQVVGIPAAIINAKENVRYHRDPDLPIKTVDAGDANAVFFMNSTRIGDVKACSTGGEKMPQKSTDFYPKVITGLVMMPVAAKERLP